MPVIPVVLVDCTTDSIRRKVLRAGFADTQDDKRKIGAVSYCGEDFFGPR